MNTKTLIIITCLLTCLTGEWRAHAGSETRNGGDICEDRFSSIRDDISAWITAGGANTLKFTSPATLQDYTKKMPQKILAAKVSCNDDVIKIGQSEKTCSNQTGPDGVARIFCNTVRFNRTSAEDQYILVHHEYAGLAGFEVNQGEESVYTLSDQISAYLEEQVVKKLAVKAAPPESRKVVISCDFKQSLSAGLLSPIPHPLLGGISLTIDLTSAPSIGTFEVLEDGSITEFTSGNRYPITRIIPLDTNNLSAITFTRNGRFGISPSSRLLVFARNNDDTDILFTIGFYGEATLTLMVDSNIGTSSYQAPCTMKQGAQ